MNSVKAFVVSCVIAYTLMLSNAAGAVQYKTIVLPSTYFGAAYDINSSGQISGQSGYNLRASLWSDMASPEILGTLRGYRYSQALSINTSGKIVGSSYGDSSPQLPFVWDEASGIQELTLPTGMTTGWASAINDNGTIIGSAVSSAGNAQAIIWDSSLAPQVLQAVLNRPNNVAKDINAAGQIAGYAYTDYDDARAVIWDANGNPRVLKGLSSYSSYAQSINNLGQAVGYSYNGTTGHDEACIWDSAGQIHELGWLPGFAEYSCARCINDAGYVVGYSQELYGKNRAFVWNEQTGLIDLGVPTGYTSSEAVAINENGWIVGRASGVNGMSIALLWQPVPEPSSILTLLCGAAGAGALGLRRRR